MSPGHANVRSLWRVLGDALPVAVVALVTFRLLQNHVADRYPVDSGSMQPAIHGAAVGGDMVLVDKLADPRELRRHDLAVFCKPDKPREQIIKRIAALGDDADACWIDLRDGDLWLGPDRQRMRRDTKDPLATRDLRVPWTRWPVLAGGERALLRLPEPGADGRLDLPAVADDVDSARALFTIGARQGRYDAFEPEIPARGFLGTTQAVDSTYVDRYGQRGREAPQQMDDVGMDVQLTTTASALLLTLEVRPHAWTFVWRPADGRCELLRDDTTIGTHALAPTNGPVRLEFGLLDHRLFLIVNGGAAWSFELPDDARAGDPGPTARPWPHNLLTLGCIGGGARVASVEVFHDIHHARNRITGLPGPAEWPQLVPPGTAFVLGDNTMNSVDSRAFGPLPLASFLGRPRGVLGPWPRHFWFPR